MRRASAFTLLELVIAAGIGVSLTAGLVLLLHDTFAASTTLAQHAHAYALAEDLSDRWDAEAISAFAIFIPPADVLGASNADGHEVDFYTQDGHGKPFFWAYRFDNTKHMLQRYAYSTPGVGVTASGDPLTSVTSFVATNIPVNAFTEPVFKGYAFTPVVERLGYPGVAGGNAVTELRLVTGDDDVTADLLPGVAPSGFTIVVGTFTPAPTALVVNPTTLTFASPRAAPQTFSVSQANYAGDFGVPAQCVVGTGQSVPAGTVAATVSGSVAGPSTAMTVTPNGSMMNAKRVTCTLAVSGGGGQTATETINVDPGPPQGSGGATTIPLAATGFVDCPSAGDVLRAETVGPVPASEVPTFGEIVQNPGGLGGDGQQGPEAVLLIPPMPVPADVLYGVTGQLMMDPAAWEVFLTQVQSLPLNANVDIALTLTLTCTAGGGL